MDACSRHVCRVQPLPAEVAASFDQIEAEPIVDPTMNGPSEFHVGRQPQGLEPRRPAPGHRRLELVVARPAAVARPFRPFSTGDRL
jgi:hypothetical protein